MFAALPRLPPHRPPVAYYTPRVSRPCRPCGVPAGLPMYSSTDDGTIDHQAPLFPSCHVLQRQGIRTLLPQHGGNFNGSLLCRCGDGDMQNRTEQYNKLPGYRMGHCLGANKASWLGRDWHCAPIHAINHDVCIDPHLVP